MWGNGGITFREREHARKETGNILKTVAYFGSSLEKVQKIDNNFFFIC